MFREEALGLISGCHPIEVTNVNNWNSSIHIYSVHSELTFLDNISVWSLHSLVNAYYIYIPMLYVFIHTICYTGFHPSFSSLHPTALFLYVIRSIIFVRVSLFINSLFVFLSILQPFFVFVLFSIFLRLSQFSSILCPLVVFTFLASLSNCVMPLHFLSVCCLLFYSVTHKLDRQFPSLMLRSSKYQQTVSTSGEISKFLILGIWCGRSVIRCVLRWLIIKQSSRNFHGNNDCFVSCC